MIIVFIAAMVCYLLLYFASRNLRCSGQMQKGISAVFYKMGLYLVSVCGKKNFSQKKVMKNLTSLYPTCERETLRKHYYAQKIGTVLLLLFAGFVFLSALWISDKTGSLLQDGYLIERGSFGEEDREVVLQIETEMEKREEIEKKAEDETYGKNEKDQKSGKYPENRRRKKHELTYLVASRKYEQDFVKEQMKTFEAHPENYILGENASLEEVCYPLLLRSSYADFVFSVEWESEDYTLVDSDGGLQNESLQSPVCVMLTAQMSYDTISASCSFPVQVVPAKKTEEELFAEKIGEAVRMADETQKTEEVLTLPNEIGGQKIIYSLEDQKQYVGYLFLLLAVAAILYVARDHDLEKKAQLRQKELLLMYPEFISQFVLLTGAGMTVRNVLLQLSTEKTLGESLGQELLLLVRDLGNGILETEALDRFGKRCGCAPYIKFSGLLIQNMKKGNDTLLQLLQQEAGDAFTKRKNDARKLGEEAGTKLLLPMMGMLVVVVILLIVPAFLSFRV